MFFGVDNTSVPAWSSYDHVILQPSCILYMHLCTFQGHALGFPTLNPKSLLGRSFGESPESVSERSTVGAPRGEDGPVIVSVILRLELLHKPSFLFIFYLFVQFSTIPILALIQPS